MEVVVVDGLGICEHCETILSFKLLPEDHKDIEGSGWHRCPNCKKLLSTYCWGYGLRDETVDEHRDYGRLEWVGPDGKWHKEKPEEDFVLGNLQVKVSYPYE